MLYKDDYMLASLGDLRNLLELSNGPGKSQYTAPDKISINRKILL